LTASKELADLRHVKSSPTTTNQEAFMENTIKIDNRTMSRALVAFVSPAEPDPSRSEQFHSWVNLTNGRAFGAKDTPEAIAKDHGLSYLENDRVAINRGAEIRVRTYTPSEARADLTAPNGDPLKTEISVAKGPDRRWHNLSADPDAVARIVFPDNDIITIHRDRVPKSQVVLYETYAPREDDMMQAAQGSARLLSGRFIRSELTPEEFAFEHGFNHLQSKQGDNIAFNPSLLYTLEDVDHASIAARTNSDKEWQSRVSWEGKTNQEGGSKLLLTDSEHAAQVVFKREPQGARRSATRTAGPAIPAGVPDPK
jgi:hypothetical protein